MYYSFIAETNLCNDDQFRCNSGQCVNNSKRCDFVPDCLDRSDEQNCAEGCLK